MIIWYALRRIFAKHFLFHMTIPLLGGAVTELYLVPRLVSPGSASGPTTILELLTWEHLIPVIGIVASYLIVMLFLVTKEVSIPFETANFTRVAQQLRDATSYFALCDIPMREWFEPGAFKYFSLLQSKKESAPGGFRYERVIVFKHARNKSDAEATVLDRFHADALATSHRRLGIPMGWLGPNEFREILGTVEKQHRLKFRKVPRLLRWIPDGVLRSLPLPAELDFAVIDRAIGKAVIIVPFKKSETVVLEGDDAKPYLDVAERIKAKVYEADGITIRLDHDFPGLLGIG